MCGFVHDFWMFDLATEIAFCQPEFSDLKNLQNTYNFLRRENTKLHLRVFNFVNWSHGISEHGESQISSSCK